MFSNNGKISENQLTRLLIMDLFTGGCLFLPMALSRTAGRGGLIACLLGLGITWLEAHIIFKFIFRFERLSISNGFLRWLCGLRCMATFVFLMGMFASVLSETFLNTMSKGSIIGGMVLLLIYGGFKGLEVRARLSEILFYIILIPIILIGLFSLPEAQWSRLINVSDCTLSGIIWGGLITWVLMSPVEWMLYIAVEKPEKSLKSAARKAIIIGGGLILIIYVLCLVVMDVPGMAGERWPTVILMQIIKIPGGFLSRQDSLMLSFWIFGMYISLSGAMGHAAELFRLNRTKNKPWKFIFLVIAGGLIVMLLGMDLRYMKIYFYGMIISGILLFLILSVAANIGKIKKQFMTFCVIGIISGCLFGCEKIVALENREFIMAIGIDAADDGNYLFTYAFPDMAQLTGKGSGTKQEPLTLKAKSLNSAEQQYNRMSDKLMDYGQVKVIVLGEKVIEDKNALWEIISEIREKNQMARTICMCRSLGTAKGIIDSEKNMEGSIGIYLETLFQNHECEYILNEFIQDHTIKSLPEVIIIENRVVLIKGNR